MSVSTKLLQAAAGVGGAEPDEDFASTTLLLQADDVNDGSQNNTFLDSSTNAHTITRNGNVTQGSFSPFSQDEGKWGNYFDGTDTDDIRIPSSSASALGDDFTVEMWINPNSLDTSFSNLSASTIIDADSSLGGGTAQWTIHQNGANIHVVADNAFALQTTSNLLVAGKYQHVALVRSSNTLTVYVDGVDAGNTTYTPTITGNRSIIIGRQTTTSARYFKGYISNVRVIPGTAVYTSAFTPPTEPLTAISGTELLTCQSNRFVDNSSNAHSITVNGDPEVTPFSPFAPSTAYNPATKGGSGYFDGTGDYLSFITSFRPLGGFTVEAWVYKTTSDKGQIFSSDLSPNRQFSINASQQIEIYDGAAVTSTGTINLNEWNHVAVSRSGSTYYFFINGEASGTGSASNTMQFDRIGVLGISNNLFNGYISDLRLVDPTALYTSAFTPPTAPVTNITNTELLLNFTNAGIYDGTGRNVLETVGDAHAENSVKKYGTGSMQFDGTGDWIKAPISENTKFGTGDYTIEMWIYPTTTNTGTLFDSRSANPQANGVSIFQANTALQVYSDSFDINASAVLTLNQWQHVALVRSSGTLTAYVDGSSVGTTANTDNHTAGETNIGVNTAEAFPYTGYIDDLRITKGVARYTANFTPPAAKLPNL